VFGATFSTHWMFGSILQRFLISLFPQLHVSKLNLTICNIKTKIRAVKTITMHFLLHLLIYLFFIRDHLVFIIC
jgi:cytochrome bd-type quinol oxidase subunit 2